MRGVRCPTNMALPPSIARYAAVAAVAAGCAGSPPASGHVPLPSAAPSVAQPQPWREDFVGRLQWGSPSGHGPELLASVYRVEASPGVRYLSAHHDARGENPPPAMHYGRGFEKDAPRLEQAPRLRFRWRVRQHPQVTDDPWLDLGASVYVVIKQPGLLSGGRGFKLGWVAKPAPLGTRQRGLFQVPLRSDAASDAWQQEDVDVCAMYRRSYGPCEGQRVVYVGVVTDADGTKSVAAGDYADFSLNAAR